MLTFGPSVYPVYSDQQEIVPPLFTGSPQSLYYYYLNNILPPFLSSSLPPPFISLFLSEGLLFLKLVPGEYDPFLCFSVQVLSIFCGITWLHSQGCS